MRHHLILSEPVADVWRDGARVGMTPFTIELNEGEPAVELRLVASGYAPTPVTVAWGDATERSVTLPVLARAEPPAPAARSAPVRPKRAPKPAPRIEEKPPPPPPRPMPLE